MPQACPSAQALSALSHAIHFFIQYILIVLSFSYALGTPGGNGDTAVNNGIAIFQRRLAMMLALAKIKQWSRQEVVRSFHSAASAQRD